MRIRLVKSEIWFRFRLQCDNRIHKTVNQPQACIVVIIKYHYWTELGYKCIMKDSKVFIAHGFLGPHVCLSTLMYFS